MDSNKLRRLAGIPIDLSKPANAKLTVRTPTRLAEAAKVPQHRGELAPKTKDNMRARVNHAKKALEALELARDELMDLPAIDYMEDVPTIIKQLHQMLHGEDGTGGLHHLHRHYKNEFDNTTFPEDIEEEKRKSEEEAQQQEAGITGDEADTSKKKTNEGLGFSVGFTKQKVDPAKENKKPFKLADGSLANDKTMVADKEQAKEVGEDPAENTETDDKVVENTFGLSLGSSRTPSRRPQLSGPGSQDKINPALARAAELAGVKKPESKNPFGEEEEDGEKRCPDCGEFGEIRGHMGCQYPSDEEDCSDMAGPMMGEGKNSKKPKWLEKAEVKAEEKEGEKVSAKEKKKVDEAKKPKWLEKAEVKAEEKEGKKVSAKEKKKVDEASGPLFARDAQHPKHNSEEQYSSWTNSTKPVNVISDDEPSLYYPNGSKRENANQLSTNPYNENQKATVPAKIKTQLKEEADKARKLAETFTMRKDWDSKNFHETLANALDTLNQFLDKGTIYGIKEAQVFMTSLMSPFTNKIPADVIKFVASGGSLRSLKSYVNDVKEPHTGTVFQQDSDGTK